jgi:anti-sigma-K factor RskA
VIFNPEQRKTMVLVSALAPAVGKDYELWVIREKTAPIPAGTFKPGPDGRAIHPVPADLSGNPGTLAITLEPEGGSRQPTSAPFLLGAVEKT